MRGLGNRCSIQLSYGDSAAGKIRLSGCLSRKMCGRTANRQAAACEKAQRLRCHSRWRTDDTRSAETCARLHKRGRYRQFMGQQPTRQCHVLRDIIGCAVRNNGARSVRDVRVPSGGTMPPLRAAETVQKRTSAFGEPAPPRARQSPATSSAGRTLEAHAVPRNLVQEDWITGLPCP